MVGIGLIGTGYWGKNHARVYRELLQDGLIEVVCRIFCNLHGPAIPPFIPYP